jgi:DNA-binding response OmpR family regulator
MAQVLLIEDDQFLSALLRNRLQKEQFDVVVVKDGVEALDTLKTLRPGVILLDIILPGKSGFEILEEIKSDPQIKDTPVIVISNLGQESDVDRMKGMGAVDYFVKARTSIDEIVQKVKGTIAQ